MPAILQQLFNKYNRFAKSIMGALPPEKVPQDLSDTHLFVKACDIVGTDNNYFDEDILREVATTVENGHESCLSMVKVSCGVGCEPLGPCRWDSFGCGK